MILVSFSAEESSTKFWGIGASVCWRSENPNGILEATKNKIRIIVRTDFNQKLPQHKKLQKFLGVELNLQEFGVDHGLGDWINWSHYP